MRGSEISIFTLYIVFIMFVKVLLYLWVFYIISDFFLSSVQFWPLETYSWVQLIFWKIRYFVYFDIAQCSFPPGCHEQTGSCFGTSGTIVGTMNTACPKSWPVHPAGTGAVWVRSTHFCTTGPLCRLFQPWSSLIQSMYLSRFLSVL